MIEGAPGVGKAALLDHYEEQFRDYCRGRGAYYVIRYQPAPAVAWLLHTILRSLGHLEKIGRKLALCGAAKSGEVKECAQSPDVRIVLDILAHAAESDARLAKCARLARARERYFALLPELEGRLQDRIPLSPIMYPLEAHRLSSSTCPERVTRRNPTRWRQVKTRGPSSCSKRPR